eukprot:1191523-Prorocentrum_minimum.AAC.1
MPWGYAPPPSLGIFEWAAFVPEWAEPSRNRVLEYTAPRPTHPGRASLRSSWTSTCPRSLASLGTSFPRSSSTWFRGYSPAPEGS